MQRSNQVCRSGAEPKSKSDFQRLLAMGWTRVWAGMGTKLRMAEAMGERDINAVDRGASATNLPEAHKVFNSLCADSTALDEVLQGYGFRLVPITAEAANDLTTAAGVINAMGELVRALDDGKRDHNETLAVAAMLRPYMPALMGILGEADGLRGAA